jgi:hypothetical protein
MQRRENTNTLKKSRRRGFLAQWRSSLGYRNSIEETRSSEADTMGRRTKPGASVLHVLVVVIPKKLETTKLVVVGA